MKKPIYTFGSIFLLIVFVALIKACTSSPATETAKKESPFIDDKYETEWQEGTQASDFDSIASHLSLHSIPCGEIYVKQSNDATGSYLCACRTDVTDPWAFYQIWSNVTDVIPVPIYKVQNKPK